MSNEQHTWTNYINWHGRQVIPENLKRLSLTELEEKLPKLIERRDRAMESRQVRQNCKELVWHINDLIAAHKKANDYNNSLNN